ncbi:MAG: PIG-L deacetylase family protein [Candidatus Promineifilaceae bacterium]|jgi:LmbE family N-acetylglucosaminyl deacetylase
MKPTLLAVLAHPDDESFGLGGTLARYADEGVDVHIAIATDGVAGSVAEGYEESLASLVEVRTQELNAAVDVLGGHLHMLGFRDSGYIGDPANKHPDAFINIDDDLPIAKVVSLIRELRPQVVITHDETGGYFHPDHIHCCEITTAAFFAAGDPQQYPQNGLTPYQPQRLYYSALPDRMIWLFTTLLRLRGKDPTKMGRNKDIDYTQLGIPNEKLHARINYRHYWDLKKLASAQHQSQGGGTSNSRSLPDWIQRRFLSSEYFIRAYPTPMKGETSRDLFDGVEVDD